MKILVTGGTGFIGSHTVVELIKQNHTVTIIDNLSNSNLSTLSNIEKITNTTVPFYEVDCSDKEKLNEVFKTKQFDGVIHFAGLKAVSESIELPLLYYRNNLDSTLSLCQVMESNNVSNLIFSSSATVYGSVKELPLTETSQTGKGITNPYGQTKYMLEQIIKDIAFSHPNWRVSLLRYFNPIGAHESGLIGEAPNGIPNNLMPYIAKVATRQLPFLRVFGNKYNTKDGTGLRDYIHVVDLAKGHIAALHHLADQENNVEIYNLGTGQGTTVFELIKAFEQASGIQIPYKIVDRRSGDIPACFADVSKARKELNWQATKTILEACQDTWRWISKNSD